MPSCRAPFAEEPLGCLSCVEAKSCIPEDDNDFLPVYPCDNAPRCLDHFEEEIRHDHQDIRIIHSPHVDEGHVLDEGEILEGRSKVLKRLPRHFGRLDLLDHIDVGKLIEIAKGIDVIGCCRPCKIVRVRLDPVEKRGGKTG